MANYYIADLHIGHAKVLEFDQRPFANLNEMHQTIADRWNRTVKVNDTVYILGDFCWAKEAEWPRYLAPLAGRKVLIRGNHDPKQFSKEVRRFFQDVKDYKEITDSQKHVILSHYPMPFHKAAYNPDCWMLYGHVHNTWDEELMEQAQTLTRQQIRRRRDGTEYNLPCQMINCFCMYSDYTPLTLDEWIELDAKRKGAPR